MIRILQAAPLLLTVVLASCNEQSPPQPTPSTTLAEKPDAEARLRNIVEQSVREYLKDADSAQFRYVSVYPKNDLVCGYVNSKNSFGAYTGFERFVADGKSLYFDSTNPRAMKKEQKRCDLAQNAKLMDMRDEATETQKDAIKGERENLQKMKDLIAGIKSGDLDPATKANLIKQDEEVERQIQGLIDSSERDLARNPGGH